MTITILILIHLLFIGKIIDWTLDNFRPTGGMTTILLILVCWQYNSTWGVITLCYGLIWLFVSNLIYHLTK